MMDNNGMDKVQFVALTKEELKDMLAEAALIGASVASEILEKAHRKELKEQKDGRLHNTKLLLKNYRMLKENCEKSVFEKEHQKENTSEVIESIMSMKGDKVIVDSIKRSADRTKIIIEHIDKMMEVYRVYCSKASDREKRQYKIIKAMYISKNRSNVMELAQKYKVSKVTIYEDIKIAVERLSALIFGVNGIRFFQ